IPEQPIPTGFASEDLAFAVEEEDESARAIETIATHTRWQVYPVEVQGGRFVARTEGLPGHRVRLRVAAWARRRPPASGPAPGSPACRRTPSRSCAAPR